MIDTLKNIGYVILFAALVVGFALKGYEVFGKASSLLDNGEKELIGVYEYKLFKSSSPNDSFNMRLTLKEDGIGQCDMNLSDYPMTTKLNYDINTGNYQYSDGKYKYVSFSNFSNDFFYQQFGYFSVWVIKKEGGKTYLKQMLKDETLNDMGYFVKL